MNKLCVAIGFLLIIGAGTVSAQINIELQGQYCAFDMKDLKALQDNFFSDLPVSVKKVTSFPDYFGLRGSATYVFESATKRPELGAVFMYTSTGGRLQYKDFSGSITGDQLTNALTLGIVGKIPLIGNDKFKFGGSTVVGIDFTNLDLIYRIKIGPNSSSEQLSFKATGYSVTPSIFFKYTPKQKLYFLVDIGYKLTFDQDTFRWSEDDAAELYIDGSGDPLKPSWDGLRAGIGIGYFLQLK
jgi:hypothetical protein